jgi:soluble lytic murein transglycosylase-like protein
MSTWRATLPRRALGFGVFVLTAVSAYLCQAGVPDAATRAADEVRRTAAEMTRAAAPAPAPTIESHIREAARRYEISEDLVAAVIAVESDFNPRAVSHRGAQGLMQLMPATAATLGVRDAFDPRDNIHGGVRHLRWLMERFDHDVPTVLAAYNAGEGAVLKHGRRPPSRETRDYVKRVMRRMKRAAARS